MYTTGKKISESLMTAYMAIAMVKEDPVPIFLEILRDHNAVENLCTIEEDRNANKGE